VATGITSSCLTEISSLIFQHFQTETQSDPRKVDTATSTEATVDLATDETVDNEEEEEETSTLRELMDALDEMDSPGSTCAAGPAKCLPAHPGLHVEGVGHIALPIIEGQAKALAAVAQQAPHGQGMKTVIDTTVRKTWQIEPRKIRLENPAWPVALEQLTAQAAIALGVEARLVRAELYKVLLYEPGGFFKKHRDTEKATGMFATLVVQLPSRYTGGAFVVSHGGETKEFTLGSGGDASYCCHFVTHYADCEHEIQPVESGYRLALVYSLCYTGGNKYKPTAAAVSDVQGRLTSILDRLPNEERRFILPLGHQYTTSSLARLGLNALKGGDRDIQVAIASASQESWKFIIVHATRTDSESGDGDDYYSGFEASHIEEGDPCLDDEAYGHDGSDCSEDMPWIKKLVNFCSIDDDGMVLADEDEVKEMWGDGDSGSVEYTGNEGANRDTTYQTYFLLAYSSDAELELMCSNDLSRAVHIVSQQNEATKTARLLAYLARSGKSLSSLDCRRLLPLVLPPTNTPIPEQIQTLSAVLKAWNLNEAVEAADPPEFVELLLWCQAAKDCPGVVAMLSTFFSQSTSSIDALLRKAHMAACLEAASSGGSFAAFLPELLRNIIYTKPSYPYRNKSTWVARRRQMQILLATHGWNMMKTFVYTYVDVVIQHEMKLSEANFRETVELLRSLDVKYSNDEKVRAWCSVVSQALVDDIEKPFLKEQRNAYGGYSSRPKQPLILNGPDADEAVNLLFKFGQPALFDRIEKWALTRQSNQDMGRLDEALTRVHQRSRHSNWERVQTLLAKIKRAKRDKDVATLLTKREQLVKVTRIRLPAFSWCMPLAAHSIPQIQAFLRSSEEGPKTIVVGGGIGRSRGIDNSQRLSHKSVPTSQPWSAVIRNTNATGNNSSVVVRKTRDYYNAQTKTYQDNAAELSRVEVEIRRLGGEVPGTRTLTAVSENPQPLAKKQKVKAPIPDDAEVIAID
jgi:hypothetical protein